MIGQSSIHTSPKNPVKDEATEFSCASVETVFYPGEFRCQWERSLWEEDVEPVSLIQDPLISATTPGYQVNSQLPCDSVFPPVLADDSYMNVDEEPTETVEVLLVPINDFVLPTDNEPLRIDDLDIEDIPKDLPTFSTDDDFKDILGFINSGSNSIDLDNSFDSGFEESLQCWSNKSLINQDEEKDERDDPTFSFSPIFSTKRKGRKREAQESLTPVLKTPKRKVGRPCRTYVTVAEIPVNATKKEKQELKKRRMRDLNNIASQKCRARKKELRLKEEQECISLENRNKQLRQRTEELSKQITELKKLMTERGINYSTSLYQQ